jgi:hypothetical protein
MKGIASSRIMLYEMVNEQRNLSRGSAATA